MNYYYSAFGLSILSELFFPDLSPEPERTPDVSIGYGLIPDTLIGGTQVDAFTWASSGHCLMAMPGHARFLVTKDSIAVERQEGADDDLIALLIQRAGFGVLLQLRNFLVLRGSAVEIEGKGIAIAAPATVGGSTLAAAMLKRGARLLADELCVIRTNNEGIPEIYPAFPCIHLWNDIVVAFGENPGNLRQIRQRIEKYALPLHDKQIARKALPLAQLFCLEIHPNKDVLVSSVSGMFKVHELSKNCYRKRLSAPLGINTIHFKESTSAATRVEIFKLGRPDRRLSADILAERIGETIR